MNTRGKHAGEVCTKPQANNHSVAKYGARDNWNDLLTELNEYPRGRTEVLSYETIGKIVVDFVRSKEGYYV